MTFTRYKDVLDPDNQDLIRNKLVDYIMKHPMNMNTLAQEIGISYITLHRFITSKTEARFKVLMMIENYLKDKE